MKAAGNPVCPRTPGVTPAALGEPRRGSQARALQLVPLVMRVRGVRGTARAVVAALLLHLQFTFFFIFFFKHELPKATTLGPRRLKRSR